MNPRARIRIALLSYWRQNSGASRRGGEDMAVLRDPTTNLPMLTGRALKGLLREGVRLAEDFGHVAAGNTDELFGIENKSTTPAANCAGLLLFSSAVVPHAVTLENASGLFATISSTALTNQGVVKGKTLRVAEVAIPLALEAAAEFTGDPSATVATNWLQDLRTGASLVRCLGASRHRGFGRCLMTVELEREDVKSSDDGVGQVEPAAAVPIAPSTSRWLGVELLSEVVVTSMGATEGRHDTLDYLPGSVFLGAVAARLFSTLGCDALLSGRIRFGAALPYAEGRIHFPIPFCLHSRKGAAATGELCNFLQTAPVDGIQYQQRRSGYLSRDRHFLEVADRYHPKTAVDRDKFGRPRDQSFFGYRAIAPETKFALWIECEPGAEADMQRAINLLCGGAIRLGRSRSAEFGQARLFPILLGPEEPAVDLADRIAIYFASDTALFHNGGPTLQPRPEHFALPKGGAEFHADQSYLRTRRYSPWNAFHGCRDTERQVICRGSVAVFKASNPDLQAVIEHVRRGVGGWTQEGLGWVMVNPAFIVNAPETLRVAPASPAHAAPGIIEPSLTGLLLRKRQDRVLELTALKLGRHWAASWSGMARKLKRDEKPYPGNSQWSALAAYAVEHERDWTGLRAAIVGFCTQGTRSTWWSSQVESSSIYDQVMTNLDAALPGDVTALIDPDDLLDTVFIGRVKAGALYVACQEVIRSGRRQDDHEHAGATHRGGPGAGGHGPPGQGASNHRGRRP